MVYDLHCGAGLVYCTWIGVMGNGNSEFWYLPRLPVLFLGATIMVEWERELWFRRENSVSWFGDAAESGRRTAKQRLSSDMLTTPTPIHRWTDTSSELDTRCELYRSGTLTAMTGHVTPGPLVGSPLFSVLFFFPRVSRRFRRKMKAIVERGNGASDADHCAGFFVLNPWPRSAPPGPRSITN